MTRYLEDRPIPAVRGPDEAYYIIDRHHFSAALLLSDVQRAFVHVIDDLSNLAPHRFWHIMEKVGRLHPFDEQGQRVSFTKLPRGLSELKADPYRDLAWSVRERKGYRKCSHPFAEFAWASFFRDNIPRTLIFTNYEKAVERAMKLAKSNLSMGLPGHARG